MAPNSAGITCSTIGAGSAECSFACDSSSSQAPAARRGHEDSGAIVARRRVAGVKVCDAGSSVELCISGIDDTTEQGATYSTVDEICDHHASVEES